MKIALREFYKKIPKKFFSSPLPTTSASYTYNSKLVYPPTLYVVYTIRT